MNVREKFRQRRLAMGLTQTQCAALLGLEPREINRYETSNADNQSSPSKMTKRVMARKMKFKWEE